MIQRRGEFPIAAGILDPGRINDGQTLWEIWEISPTHPADETCLYLSWLHGFVKNINGHRTEFPNMPNEQSGHLKTMGHQVKKARGRESDEVQIHESAIAWGKQRCALIAKEGSLFERCR